MLRVIGVLSLLLVAGHARAQPAEPAPTEPDASEATPAPAAAPVPAPVEPPPTADRRVDDLAAELETLRDENDELREQVELLQQDLQYLDGQVTGLLPVKARVSGYLDVGFFHVAGDGSGLRSDLGHLFFPEYADVPASWVFMGDPLSTMINGRGDPAETAESRAVQFDGVDNGGAASFIVNAFNLQLFTGIGSRATVHGSVDFVPRSRDVSDPDGTFLGDYVDVKLAYASYRPSWRELDLELQAGKFDPVLGREYRVSEAPDRITVAPSLLCRYLCGRPLGLKARLTTGGFIANLAVTNGSHFNEGFTFADEVDSNDMPTAATRISYRLPIAAVDELELGVSGAVGAQDAQTANDLLQWHVGGDLHLVVADVELTGEYVKGVAEGVTEMAPACDGSPCLDYQAAYGLVAYRLSNRWIPYARVDWRDALHQDGASFVYISQLVRGTVGLRAEIGAHLIFKVDYTVNRELGRIPQFANDVATSALIVRY